jgi:sugar phosphate isomerase/epimerase
MVPVSAHTALPTKDNLCQIVTDMKALGINYAISGGGANEYKDEDSIKAFAEKIEAAAELLAPYGIQVGIHNHWFEFDHKIGKRYPHDVFMSLTQKAFAQLDIYWALFAGADPAKVIARLKGRVPVLHVKDGTLEKNEQGHPTTPHTAVGAGKVDTAACVRAAEKAGTQWLHVELDSCATDMEEAVRQSAQFLMMNGLAEGRKCGCSCCR